MPYGGAGAGAVWPPIAELNPLRCRGYYYDAETGFYYVSSRYYDPEIGRFLNATGPHYHIYGTGHYYPGMVVPEPYATIYFPFR